MTLKGIDVSEHQGVIDWAKVAKDGVQFAVLRAGYGRELSQKESSRYQGGCVLVQLRQQRRAR